MKPPRKAIILAAALRAMQFFAVDIALMLVSDTHWALRTAASLLIVAAGDLHMRYTVIRAINMAEQDRLQSIQKVKEHLTANPIIANVEGQRTQAPR